MATKRKKSEPQVAGPAAPAAEPPRVLISEGMRADLELHGQVVDPATGLLLRLDDNGRVVVVGGR